MTQGMRVNSFSTSIPNWLPSLLAMLVLSGAARAADMKIEAVLVWGTNEQKSPDRDHKPVNTELKKKLQELPLKWTSYFEVNRVEFGAPISNITTVALSKKCSLEVRNLGQSKVEVSHLGGGKRVGTSTQSLPKGETLILGGNAPGATSWLVVIRRLE